MFLALSSVSGDTGHHSLSRSEQTTVMLHMRDETQVAVFRFSGLRWRGNPEWPESPFAWVHGDSLPWRQLFVRTHPNAFAWQR